MLPLSLTRHTFISNSELWVLIATNGLTSPINKYGITFFLKLISFSDTQCFHAWNKSRVTDINLTASWNLAHITYYKNWRKTSSKFRDVLVRSVSHFKSLSLKWLSAYEMLMCTGMPHICSNEDMTRGSGGHKSCLPISPNCARTLDFSHITNCTLTSGCGPSYPIDTNYR